MSHSNSQSIKRNFVCLKIFKIMEPDPKNSGLLHVHPRIKGRSIIRCPPSSFSDKICRPSSFSRMVFPKKTPKKLPVLSKLIARPFIRRGGLVCSRDFKATALPFVLLDTIFPHRQVVIGAPY